MTFSYTFLQTPCPPCHSTQTHTRTHLIFMPTNNRMDDYTSAFLRPAGGLDSYSDRKVYRVNHRGGSKLLLSTLVPVCVCVRVWPKGRSACVTVGIFYNCVPFAGNPSVRAISRPSQNIRAPSHTIDDAHTVETKANGFPRPHAHAINLSAQTCCVWLCNFY